VHVHTVVIIVGKSKASLEMCYQMNITIEKYVHRSHCSLCLKEKKPCGLTGRRMRKRFPFLNKSPV
jgi:hypothetical protein